MTSRRLYILCGALLAAVHLARNLAGIDLKELWLDEATTWFVFRQELPRLLTMPVEYHSQPPLYYALMRGWSALGTSELFLRGFSWLCVLGLLVYVLAGPSPLKRPARLVFGLLLVSAEFTRFLSQELRPYALTALLCFPATALLFELVERPSRRLAVAYAAVLTAALYALAFSCWVAVAHGLFALAVAGARWRREGLRRALSGTRHLLGALAASAALYLPYVIAAWKLQGKIGNPTLKDSIEEVLRWPIYPEGAAHFFKFGHGAWLWLGLAGAALFALAWRKKPGQAALMFVLVLGQIGFVHGFLRHRSFVAERYFTPAFPVALAMVAVGLTWPLDYLSRPRVRLALGAAFAAGLAALLAVRDARPFLEWVRAPVPQTGWRGLRNQIVALPHPGPKGVFFDTGWDGRAFDYQTRHDDIEVFADEGGGWDCGGRSPIRSEYIAETIDAHPGYACFFYQVHRGARRDRLDSVFIPKVEGLGYRKVFEAEARGHNSSDGFISGYCR